MKLRAYCVALLSAVFLVVSPSSSQPLDPHDLEYLGAFRLPSSFDWGARGATYRPTGDSGKGSLLIVGRDSVLGEWGQVNIPQPKISGYSALPQATLIGAMKSFDSALIETTVTPSESYVGDVECLSPLGTQTTEKCYWNVNWWYNTGGENYPAIGMSEVNGSNPRGMWHVGPKSQKFHGSRHGQYLFKIPDWFAAAHLGGRQVMAGMHREAGAFGASQGPTLFAFRAWTQNSPPNQNLDALALVYYREKYPSCAGPNVGNPSNCDFPGYRAGDRWEGGAFLDAGAKSAIVISGVKGLGTNFYGQGRSSDCTDWQGYHSDPYDAQLLFYDPEDIAKSAKGQISPWKVVPKHTWSPPQTRTSCPRMGGVAVDQAGGRLFVIEKGYGSSNSDVAVVHVYGFMSQLSGSDFEIGGLTDWSRVVS